MKDVEWISGTYWILSRPLIDLLKEVVPFVWTPNTQEAVQILKQALVQAPVSAVPDFTKQFVLEIDASDSGFGVVLMQGGHTVAYLRKLVCKKNKGM